MTEQIWDRFKEELLGFIMSRVKDKDVAQDILQDVFIKIHLKSDMLSHKEKLTSWIYQITRHTIIDYYRKNDKPTLIEAFKMDYPENDDTYNHELLCCLKPFINELPLKYQDAILKTTYGSLSQKDYAKEIDISYTAVKSRVQRARQQLKHSFIKCCSIQSDKYGNIIDINKKKCDCD